MAPTAAIIANSSIGRETIRATYPHRLRSRGRRWQIAFLSNPARGADKAKDCLPPLTRYPWERGGIVYIGY